MTENILTNTGYDLASLDRSIKTLRTLASSDELCTGRSIPCSNKLADIFTQAKIIERRLGRIGRARLAQFKEIVGDIQFDEDSSLNLVNPCMNPGDNYDNKDVKYAFNALYSGRVVAEWQTKVEEYKKLKSLDAIL